MLKKNGNFNGNFNNNSNVNINDKEKNSTYFPIQDQKNLSSNPESEVKKHPNYQTTVPTLSLAENPELVNADTQRCLFWAIAKDKLTKSQIDALLPKVGDNSINDAPAQKNLFVVIGRGKLSELQINALLPKVGNSINDAAQANLFWAIRCGKLTEQQINALLAKVGK